MLLKADISINHVIQTEAKQGSL